MKKYKYFESDFENAVLELFEMENYVYVCGHDMHRVNTTILIEDDFATYLNKRYSNEILRDEEIEKILHNLKSSIGLSLYDSMNSTLETLRNGYTLIREKYNLPSIHIDYFDYRNKHIENNLFKVINQYEVKGYDLRRPDIVVFINGIPVSVIELKNLSEEKIKLHEAYLQLTTRYTRDIPNLMKYSFISMISDGPNSKVGSLFADYKHYFSWKSTDGVIYSNNGIDSLYTLIKGLYNKSTLLNIIKNYIYFPDTSSNQLMILPKYSQYYATEKILDNIKTHLKPQGDGKGGTYFGATGCGKSYTMLFLARKLIMSSELKNPTIVLITDRKDLDDQLSETFETSKKYLVDNNTLQIPSRSILNEKIKGVTSGGVFLMTIQKFDENIDLLSDRSNIICISDEAHRTQVNLDVQLENTDEGIKKHYGFAKYLRDSFPNATYVGFTGTPIDATISVFGPIVSSYKMKQSIDDGSTVGIRLLPGPSSVRLDETKLKIVDKYYSDQLKNGANKYQVEASKKAMASVRTIIDNDSRLDLIVKHFLKHYETRVNEGSTIKGKAMFVCYDRKIAYKLYKKIIALKPEWCIKKKTSEDKHLLTREQLNKLKPVEKIKMIATRDKNDDTKLYNMLGTSEERAAFSLLFKDENSNFKIAIVVDMWITGFDCECLDTMYIDKPLEKHTLIQTISRVNRIFEGKEEGLIVDYIGIEASLAKAMQLYSGDINPIKEIEATYVIFKDQLKLIDELMFNFDGSKFFSGTPLERLKCLNQAAEYVQTKNETETRFMAIVLRMKKAYDLCVGDDRITEDEMFKTHFYCAIRSIIYKTSGEETPDTERMNKKVKKLVDSCIYAMSDYDEEEVRSTNIFSKEYLKKIDGIPYKNIKFKMLIELLRKTINAYGKVNKVKSIEFSEKMKILVDKYNARDAQVLVSDSDVINDFIDDLTEEAKRVLNDIQDDANSFKDLGITFEEKAFYDILKSIRDKYKFEYKEEKIVVLSKKVKAVVDDKSKYTDWSSRNDIKSNLQSDVIRILHKNGYPPMTFEEVYKQVLEQAENFAKYRC